MPGLEGALLDVARATPPGDVRALVRALHLDNRGPWNTVCGHCFAEAHSAGLVEVKGRVFKKIVFTDMAAAEALRERNDELREARGALPRCRARAHGRGDGGLPAHGGGRLLAEPR